MRDIRSFCRDRDSMSTGAVPRLRYWLVLSVCVACAGCPPANAPSLTSASVAIGHTQAEYVVANGKLFLVVWVTVPREGGSGGSGVSATAEKTEIKGFYAPSGGARVDWTCTTSDLKTGAVTINGADYQLADGGLFLITLGDHSPKVVQLHRDLSTTEPSQQGLEKLAREDAEVSAFVAGEAAAE